MDTIFSIHIPAPENTDLHQTLCHKSNSTTRVSAGQLAQGTIASSQMEMAILAAFTDGIESLNEIDLALLQHFIDDVALRIAGKS